jgi:hypothetical protein
MVYSTRGNMIVFTIEMQASCVSGTDFKANLADIIEHYEVFQIERID